MNETIHTGSKNPVVKHTVTGVKMRGRTREQNVAAIRLAEHEDIRSVTNHSTNTLVVHPYSMDAIREIYYVAEEFNAEMDFWYMSTEVSKIHPVFDMSF